jgi:hypothetical protein
VAGADRVGAKEEPEDVVSGARFIELSLGLAVAIALSGAADAEPRIEVTLAGRDDALPKLGRPGITVRVEGTSAGGATVIKDEISRELAQQVHTRPLAKDEAGDYALEVILEEPRLIDTAVTAPFSAVLKSSRGQRLWRIEGRSEVEGQILDAAVFSGIARNVVSALVHDGWLQPRYDPDNPPPQAPRIRSQ